MNKATKTLNFDIQCDTLEGETISMEQYQDKVLLIVNTASKCGFTPQYEGLQKLYETYKDRDFVVLGFPCNQFLHQEPADSGAIQEFCQVRFGVDFPLFKKIDVNGPDTHPLFKQLKKLAPGLLGSENIKWNFTKFLVAKNGSIIDRYAPKTEPEKLTSKIEKLLD